VQFDGLSKLLHLGVLGADTLRDGGNLGLRLLDRDAAPHPADARMTWFSRFSRDRSISLVG